jgi:hypothetical protein
MNNLVTITNQNFVRSKLGLKYDVVVKEVHVFLEGFILDIEIQVKGTDNVVNTDFRAIRETIFVDKAQNAQTSTLYSNLLTMVNNAVNAKYP